jgi:hypothetical protein
LLVECDPGEGLMADKTLAHHKRTFQSRPRLRLTGASLIIALAVGCLVVAMLSAPPGVAYRIIWAVIWLAFAWFGIRLARLATQVRGDHLVIRGFFHTRRFDASQITKIGLDRLRNGANGVYVWIPRAYLRSGRSVRLWGLGSSGGTQERPALIAAVDEISALLQLSD